MKTYPTENPLESLSNTIPFSSRDWGVEVRDAWIYGIVCGWDDDCFKEFEQKFCWSKETFDRLKRLHLRFEEMTNAIPHKPLTLEGGCTYCPLCEDGCISDSDRLSCQLLPLVVHWKQLMLNEILQMEKNNKSLTIEQLQAENAGLRASQFIQGEIIKSGSNPIDKDRIVKLILEKTELQVENASLKARLEKAIELPETVFVAGYNCDGCEKTADACRNCKRIEIVEEKFIFKEHLADLCYGDGVYRSREEAEKALEGKNGAD